MKRYLIRRFLGGLLVLWFVSIFVFLIVRGLPGDALVVLIQDAGAVPAERLDQMRAEMGLDDPLLVAYGKWAGALLRGDMGESLVYQGESVSSRLGRSLIPTLQLAIMGSAIGIPLAIGIGMISGLRQNTWYDYPLRLVAILSLSVPNFVVAMVVLLFLSRQLGYSPPFGWVPIWEDPWANLQIIILPVLITAFAVSGTLMRMTRSSVIEVMRQDYVRTARAKGLTSNAVIQRHIARNALISVTTILGIAFIFLLSGSVIMEVLFAIPGVGRLTLESIQIRDYPQIMGNTMFYASIVIAANLAIDLLYGVIDPRVRYN